MARGSGRGEGGAGPGVLAAAAAAAECGVASQAWDVELCRWYK
jgi:hypothetical protein